MIATQFKISNDSLVTGKPVMIAFCAGFTWVSFDYEGNKKAWISAELFKDLCVSVFYCTYYFMSLDVS